MCVEIVHARAEHLRELLMQQGWQAKTIDLLCRSGPPSFPVELGPESHRMQNGRRRRRPGGARTD